jgi:hypothetical protein
MGMENKKLVIEPASMKSEAKKPEPLVGEEPRHRKKPRVGLYVALVLGCLLAVGITFWMGLRETNVVDSKKEEGATGADSTKAASDTFQITQKIDTSNYQNQLGKKEKTEPWFDNSKNRFINVNGKQIQVADSHYPKKWSYRNIKRVLNDGWRLPTKAELEAIYRKNYLDGTRTSAGWRYYLCLSNDKSSFAHYGLFFDPPGEWVIDHAYTENPEWDVSEPSRSHFVKDY